MGASAFTLKGSFGAELIKPWVSVAALFVSFKAPQLLARQAMVAGLTPSLGNAAARTLVYGRAAMRAGGAAHGAEGVSGRRFTDDREGCGWSCDISGPNRVAIHGGCIERRLGEQRPQRLCEHAPTRLADSDALGAGRLHSFQDGF